MWWTSKFDHFLVAAVFSTYSNIKTRNDFLHFPNMIFHFITRTSVNILFRFSFVATRRRSSSLSSSSSLPLLSLSFHLLRQRNNTLLVRYLMLHLLPFNFFLFCRTLSIFRSFVVTSFFCFCCSKIEKNTLNKLSNEIAHRWRYTSSTQRWTMKQNKKKEHTQKYTRR